MEWGFSNDKVECLIPEDKLKEYQEAFKKITEETKVEDIDELVKNFIEAEERNFSLNKFVEDLTKESNDLDEKITKVKVEIEDYKNQGLGLDNERKKQQKELEEQIAVNEAEYKKHVEEYNESLKKINQIKESIDDIFSLVDNETSRKYKELSSQQGVTHDNIMMYLGMIEEMINNMIKQYAHYLAQNLNLDPNDPTCVTLKNILMVAPKTEPPKYDGSFISLGKDDPEMSGLEEEGEPLSMQDFQKHFENKNKSAKKKP